MLRSLCTSSVLMESVAGVAGLATALALRRVGHHVLVLEREKKEVTVSRFVEYMPAFHETTVKPSSAAAAVYDCRQTSRRSSFTGA